jgi:hypothetical protein
MHKHVRRRQHSDPSGSERRIQAPALVLALLCLSAGGPAAAQYRIEWFTIDGGGTTRTSGSSTALGGTAAQPDAARMTGGTYALQGGFWVFGSTTPSDQAGDPVPVGAATRPVFKGISPNPVTRRTALLFDLPHAENVRATLYDAAGRRVRTLARGVFPRGSHRVVWDGSGHDGRRVASGVYYVRVHIGSLREVHRIVVLE